MRLLLLLMCALPLAAQNFCTDCGSPRKGLEACPECASPGYNPLFVCTKCGQNLHETMRHCPRCGLRARRGDGVLGRLAVGQRWLLRSETERDGERWEVYYACIITEVGNGRCVYQVEMHNLDGERLEAPRKITFTADTDYGHVVDEEEVGLGRDSYACVVYEEEHVRRWILPDYPVITVRSLLDNGSIRQRVELVELDLSPASE